MADTHVRASLRCSWNVFLPAFAATAALALTSIAQPFLLPTANRAIFEPGGEERYFVGTVGRPWTSGTFGCTRTEGWQFHEGLDIRPLRRDARGEATDPILSTADGTVTHVSRNAGLSSYGIYVVIRHVIEGLEIYSLYAHLASVRDDMKPGTTVRGGEAIGVMGRTANTRQGISKDRAHLHFELTLLLNDRFDAWHQQHGGGARNDHGTWNGRNLLGLDPREILLQQRELKDRFSVLRIIRGQPELMRVRVRATDFPWVRRYPQLIRANPALGTNAVAGYEVAFNFSGVPFELTPLAAADLGGAARYRLVSVNAAEQQQRPCGRLVTRQANQWRLAPAGERLVELLIY